MIAVQAIHRDRPTNDSPDPAHACIPCGTTTASIGRLEMDAERTTDAQQSKV